jgi:nitroimidazol reductase NimA-like FMN-containing flavoprotein (pyridoxamine 5'-phosphate oxidase superfamily)
MERKAVEILGQHRTMSIATLRPDGWPQATIVGFANDGLLLYFLISRKSQKFANIARDDRVAVTIGTETNDVRDLKAVYAGARASEVTDPGQREQAWSLLMKRHPNLSQFEPPDYREAAMMRAACHHISILDYSQGIGHADELSVGPAGVPTMAPARTDDWGYLPASEGTDIS